jgi:KRAB domain-containing zinc finger protein
MNSLDYGAESDAFNTDLSLSALTGEDQRLNRVVPAVSNFSPTNFFEHSPSDQIDGAHPYVSGARDGLGFQQSVVVPAPAPVKRSMNVEPGQKICPECGRYCGCRSALMVHMRTHTGEKPYVCSHEGCGKGFAQLWNLKVHMIIHTGQKPYVCSHEGCGKAFPLLGNLKKHMRRVHKRADPIASGFLNPEQVEDDENHSSEGLALQQDLDAAEILILLAAPRPMAISVVQQTDRGPNGFACTQCDKMFGLKSNLKRHMRTHSGKNPYPCKTCGEEFSLKGNLKTHMKVHKKADKITSGSLSLE